MIPNKQHPQVSVEVNRANKSGLTLFPLCFVWISVQILETISSDVEEIHPHIQAHTNTAHTVIKDTAVVLPSSVK